MKHQVIIPQNIVERMSPMDRGDLNQSTAEERSSIVDLRLERDLHKLIMNELSRRQIFYVHSRTDKKTSQNVGVPDFIFAVLGLPTAVEVKLPGRKLTADQEYVRNAMIQDGWRYEVVYSFDQFVSLLKECI